MHDTLMIGSLAAERGQKQRGWLPVPGTSIQLPLTLIHGAAPGPTLLVTGGIHGGEYPGVEAKRVRPCDCRLDGHYDRELDNRG